MKTPLVHKIALLLTITNYLYSPCSALVRGVVGLTPEEEQEVVRDHNYFRGIVDPPARNMNILVRLFFRYLVVSSANVYCYSHNVICTYTSSWKQSWSTELATTAQNYSLTCNRAENPNLSTLYPGEHVGENRLFQMTPTDNVTSRRLLQIWFNEGIFYNYHAQQCLFSCDNYIQVSAHLITSIIITTLSLS